MFLVTCTRASHHYQQLPRTILLVVIHPLDTLSSVCEIQIAWQYILAALKQSVERLVITLGPGEVLIGEQQTMFLSC